MAVTRTPTDLGNVRLGTPGFDAAEAEMSPVELAAVANGLVTRLNPNHEDHDDRVAEFWAAVGNGNGDGPPEDPSVSDLVDYVEGLTGLLDAGDQADWWQALLDLAITNGAEPPGGVAASVDPTV